MWKWTLGTRFPTQVGKFLATDDFQSALEKERLRCDRNGACFSLVVYQVPATADADRFVADFTAVLLGRLRRTDEVGALRSQMIGVLLPETPASGAWKVVDDIQTLLPMNLETPECVVYTYPTDAVYPPSERLSDPTTRGITENRPVHSLELFMCQPMPVWKRGLDILGSVTGLVLLLPLLLLCSVAVKLTSKGPVFFRQQRTGLGGVPFIMYKFRTMRNGAEFEQAALREFSEQDGPAFKLGNDPRMTRLGRFLRRVSIDELPQLFNVLRGDMSLVGPRPLPCAESNASEPWQKRRLDVTPGLTCLWQVQGRSRVKFTEWMRLDLKYVSKRTFGLDLLLIVQTVRVVFLGNGK